MNYDYLCDCCIYRDNECRDDPVMQCKGFIDGEPDESEDAAIKAADEGR